jgi:putative ABC transport system permease protein
VFRISSNSIRSGASRSGFTDRIELPWWLFVACGALTLVVALVVVLVQTLRVARSGIVEALRQE